MTFHRVEGNWTGHLFLGILLLVVAAFGFQAFRIHQLRGQLHERTTQRDSIAGDAAAERARARGFEVAFGVYTPHLAKMMKEGDSILAETVQDLQASRVRLTQQARYIVSLEGRVVSLGRPIVSEDSSSVPLSWEGELDDGLLAGSWTFSRLPQPLLGMDYFLDPEIELVQGTSGDGRILVLARGLDPRVKPILGRFYVDPLPPVIELHCPVTRLGIAGLIGAGTALLLKRESPE